MLGQVSTIGRKQDVRAAEPRPTGRQFVSCPGPNRWRFRKRCGGRPRDQLRPDRTQYLRIRRAAQPRVSLAIATEPGDDCDLGIPCRGLGVGVIGGHAAASPFRVNWFSKGAVCTKLHGAAPVDQTLGTAAVAGRFGDTDLAVILTHQQQRPGGASRPRRARRAACSLAPPAGPGCDSTGRER